VCLGLPSELFDPTQSLSFSLRCHERMTSSVAVAAMPTVAPHRCQPPPSSTPMPGLTPVSLNSFDFSPLLVVTWCEPGPPALTLVATQPAAACSPAVSPPSPFLWWWFIGAGVFFEETPLAPLAHGLSPIKEKGASAPYSPFSFLFWLLFWLITQSTKISSPTLNILF